MSCVLQDAAFLAAVSIPTLAAIVSATTPDHSCVPVPPAPDAVFDTREDASIVEVTIRIFDERTGSPTAARVRIIDGLNRIIPLGPDETLPSYGTLGRYFYVDGEITLELPLGSTSVTAGKGFERRVTTVTEVVAGEHTIDVWLPSPFDMRVNDWYSGDVHVHTKHQPEEYTISPETAQMVARGEDLAMMWCLDQLHEFTGAPHEVSDGESIIYFSSEYRNQVSGHVSLLGLQDFIDWGCCWPGSPAAPTLTETYLDWSPAAGQGMVLCHPKTTDDFFDTEGWPGNGLGRELPVQAALGTIDAVDIAAYSNQADYYVDDWYALLGTGLTVSASAGTDATLNNYFSGPAGGYRVYVQEPLGHNAVAWVEGLKAGRSFVTNYPLIPSFSVDGFSPSETLVYDADSLEVDVFFHIQCLLPLDVAEIVVNGVVVEQVSLVANGSGEVDVAHTLPLTLTESGWIALRVSGTNPSQRAHGPALFAHTNPVHVVKDETPLRRTEDSARMIRWIDDLETLTIDRGLWESPEQETETLQQFVDARDYYQRAFTLPPAAFALRSPAEADSLDPGVPLVFDWEDAVDPEPADVVTYLVTIEEQGVSGDSLIYEQATTSSYQLVPMWTLEQWRTYRWSVTAVDLGENVTEPSPPFITFETGESVVSSVDEVRGVTLPLRVWPNPSRSSFIIALTEGSTNAYGVRVLDVEGRRVATSVGAEAALPRLAQGRWIWDGRDTRGRRVASGRYWVELMTRGDGRRVGVAPVTMVR